MSRLPFALAALLLAAPVRAADFTSAAQGTTAAEFLELGVGARAVGMGEAYSAVADEASALYWNPAALTAIPGRSVTLMHAPYIASSYFDYGAYGQNLGARGAFGASFQYFSAGSLIQEDAAGNDGGSITPYDLAVTLGYAYKFADAGASLLDGFSAGVGVKYVQSKILSSAQTGAVDLGLLSPTYFDGRLNLAFTVTNLGGTLKFDQENENLPLVVRLGSSYRILDHWIGSLDFSAPRNDNPYVALGTEYQFLTHGPWKAAARAGFNSQTVGSIDGFTGISFGAGVGYDRLTMDYAIVPLGGVGQSQRISLTLNF
jgi:hypothetical protein